MTPPRAPSSRPCVASLCLALVVVALACTAAVSAEPAPATMSAEGRNMVVSADELTLTLGAARKATNLTMLVEQVRGLWKLRDMVAKMQAEVAAKAQEIASLEAMVGNMTASVRERWS